LKLVELQLGKAGKRAKAAEIELEIDGEVDEEQDEAA